jgi:hypothetical protein
MKRALGLLVVLTTLLLSLAAAPASAHDGDPDCTARPIQFIEIPPYGSTLNLKGRVNCYVPRTHRIVVYIRVNGNWWVKPYLNSPKTAINQTTHRWETDITTGPNDRNATAILVCLIPAGYAPPLANGWSSLPQRLYNTAHSCRQIDRAAG